MTMPDRPETDSGRRAEGPPRDCAHCLFLAVDERTGEEFCDNELDEDEYAALLHDGTKGCPYFQLNDEYGIVRKQI